MYVRYAQAHNKPSARFHSQSLTLVYTTPSYAHTRAGQQKYGISVYYHFLSCFQSLPIAALVKTPRGDIFCVHGGISPDVASIHAIASIDRHRELPADGALCDLLWSDPAVTTSDRTSPVILSHCSHVA